MEEDCDFLRQLDKEESQEALIPISETSQYGIFAMERLNQD